MPLQIFKIDKIPIKIHYSFFISFLIIMALSLYNGGAIYAAYNSILFLILFISVLLHELGHAFAAKKFGVSTRNITLYIFGGTAYLEKMPRDRKKEIIISLAGPLVNIVILLLSIPFVIFKLPLVAEIAIINFIMGIFNLFPAFPMDGGRILRAILSKFFGFNKATNIAITTSRVFAISFLLLGIYYKFISLVIVAAFLLITTSAEKIRLDNSNNY